MRRESSLVCRALSCGAVSQTAPPAPVVFHEDARCNDLQGGTSPELDRLDPALSSAIAASQEDTSTLLLSWKPLSISSEGKFSLFL